MYKRATGMIGKLNYWTIKKNSGCEKWLFCCFDGFKYKLQWTDSIHIFVLSFAVGGLLKYVWLIKINWNTKWIFMHNFALCDIYKSTYNSMGMNDTGGQYQSRW